MLNFMIQDFYKVHNNAHSTLFLSSSAIHDLYQVQVFCYIFIMPYHCFTVWYISRPLWCFYHITAGGLYSVKSSVTHYIVFLCNRRGRPLYLKTHTCYKNWCRDQGFEPPVLAFWVISRTACMFHAHACVFITTDSTEVWNKEYNTFVSKIRPDRIQITKNLGNQN